MYLSVLVTCYNGEALFSLEVVMLLWFLFLDKKTSSQKKLLGDIIQPRPLPKMKPILSDELDSRIVSMC